MLQLSERVLTSTRYRTATSEPRYSGDDTVCAPHLRRRVDYVRSCKSQEQVSFQLLNCERAIGQLQ
jgi:hypothetical protein